MFSINARGVLGIPSFPPIDRAYDLIFLPASTSGSWYFHSVPWRKRMGVVVGGGCPPSFTTRAFAIGGHVPFSASMAAITPKSLLPAHFNVVEGDISRDVWGT
jgi:hypothetical protein